MIYQRGCHWTRHDESRHREPVESFDERKKWPTFTLWNVEWKWPEWNVDRRASFPLSDLAQAATRQLSEAIKRFIVSYDHDEDEDMEWRPSPLQPLPESKGIDHQRRVEFLRLLKDGLGRTMAASQLGISSTTLKRTMAKSPAFRKAVEQVEQARADNLFTGLYVAALRGNTRAAMFLLSREKR